jgi:cell shape-determining protein MreC
MLTDLDLLLIREGTKDEQEPELDDFEKLVLERQQLKETLKRLNHEDTEESKLPSVESLT